MLVVRHLRPPASDIIFVLPIQLLLLLLAEPLDFVHEDLGRSPAPQPLHTDVFAAGKRVLCVGDR